MVEDRFKLRSRLGALSLIAVVVSMALFISSISLLNGSENQGERLGFENRVSVYVDEALTYEGSNHIGADWDNLFVCKMFNSSVGCDAYDEGVGSGGGFFTNNDTAITRIALSTDTQDSSRDFVVCASRLSGNGMDPKAPTVTFTASGNSLTLSASWTATGGSFTGIEKVCLDTQGEGFLVNGVTSADFPSQTVNDGSTITVNYNWSW